MCQIFAMVFISLPEKWCVDGVFVCAYTNVFTVVVTWKPDKKTSIALEYKVLLSNECTLVGFHAKALRVHSGY